MNHQPDHAALAEQLKDFAHDHGMTALRATVATGPDSWLAIEVRHASLSGDSPDGWDTTVRRESL